MDHKHAISFIMKYHLSAYNRQSGIGASYRWQIYCS